MGPAYAALEEAEKLLREEVVGGRSVALGSTHASTLDGCAQLALCLQLLSRFDDAEAMWRRTRDGRIATLGGTHTATIDATAALAELLLKMGDRDDRGQTSARPPNVSYGKDPPPPPRGVDAIGELQTAMVARTMVSGRGARTLKLARDLAGILERQEKWRGSWELRYEHGIYGDAPEELGAVVPNDDEG